MWKSARKYWAIFGKWGFVIAAVIVGDVIGIAQSYDTHFVLPQWGWWLILVVILVVSPFIAFHKMRIQRDDFQHQLGQIRNAKPNIVLKKIDEHFPGNVTMRKYDEPLNRATIVKIENPEFTRIWVANEPKDTTLAVDAIKVYGEIEFLDDSTQKQLLIMGGRWAETKEIANGGQPIEIDQIDIPPNGRPFCMDIGLKYSEEEEFYGYNNETPRKHTEGFRDKDRKFDAKTYLVRTRFRCKGVDTSFWFKLENPGKGGLISFKLIGSPPNLGKEDSRN